MQPKPANRQPADRVAIMLIAAAALLLMSASTLSGEQNYVSRYDAYVGYAYLDSPKVDLAEHGVHLQFGIRPRTWYSLGVDYSYATGDLTLKPDMLVTSLQQRLAAQLGQLAAIGRLPSGYQLAVRTHSRTQTITGGPQLAYRRFSKLTLFLRPSIGFIRELAIPKPADPIATGIVNQLAPSGEKLDWTIFWGFGGGVDINFSKHFGLRVQTDLVRDHLFNDLLREWRGTVRFSVGPCFNFGRNIAD